MTRDEFCHCFHETLSQRLWKSFRKTSSMTTRKFAGSFFRSWESWCRKYPRQPFLGHLEQFFGQLPPKPCGPLWTTFLTNLTGLPCNLSVNIGVPRTPNSMEERQGR